MRAVGGAVGGAVVERWGDGRAKWKARSFSRPEDCIVNLNKARHCPRNSPRRAPSHQRTLKRCTAHTKHPQCTGAHNIHSLETASIPSKSPVPPWRIAFLSLSFPSAVSAPVPASATPAAPNATSRTRQRLEHLMHKANQAPSARDLTGSCLIFHILILVLLFSFGLSPIRDNAHSRKTAAARATGLAQGDESRPSGRFVSFSPC